MAENREYLTQAEENGSVCISEEVIASIVTDAISEIEGVGALSQNVSGKKLVRGVRLEQQDGVIALEIYLMVRYGFAIPEVAAKVQDAVMSAVSGMTGFEVKTVNVHVSGVSFN